MKGILYIILVLALGTVALPAQAQKKLETSALSLQYPGSWVVDMNRLEINGTVRLSPKDNPAGQLGTEVVIDFRPAEQKSAETLASETSAQNSSGLKRDISTLQIGGKTAAKTTIQLGDMYTITNEVVYKDKVCRITCFTNSANRDALQKEFDMIVGSIKFK